MVTRKDDLPKSTSRKEIIEIDSRDPVAAAAESRKKTVMVRVKNPAEKWPKYSILTVKRRKEVKSKVSQRTVEMFEEKRFKLAK
jgi:hypothetical protein